MKFGCYKLDFDIYPMILLRMLSKIKWRKKKILELYLKVRLNTFSEGFAVLFEEHFINLKMYQMTVEMSRQCFSLHDLLL